MDKFKKWRWAAILFVCVCWRHLAADFSLKRLFNLKSVQKHETTKQISLFTSKCFFLSLYIYMMLNNLFLSYMKPNLKNNHNMDDIRRYYRDIFIVFVLVPSSGSFQYTHYLHYLHIYTVQACLQVPYFYWIKYIIVRWKKTMWPCWLLRLWGNTCTNTSIRKSNRLMGISIGEWASCGHFY